MAHVVKCKVCEQRFDRDKEDAVKVSGNRYAHARCVDGYEPSQDAKDLAELHQFLKALFKDNYNFVALDRQIKSMIAENPKFTHSGILKSLIYWYNVKGNSTEKSNYRIGIVPFIYQDAYNYYYAMFMANQQNIDKNIEKYRAPDVVEIRIPKPVRDVPAFRLFDLDD